jgi:hypothetical protein
MKILIATVGQSTAHLSKLKEKEFTHYYFLLSDQNRRQKETVKKLENLCGQVSGVLDVDIISADDVNNAFEVATKIIKIYNQDTISQIIVNPTGGTTSMSIGVYRASILANVETQISTGTRNCKHQITDWSHEWQTVNRKSIEVVENELFAEECLQIFDYQSVYTRFNSLIKETGSPHEIRIKEVTLTALALMKWDLLDFNKAHEIISTFKRDRIKNAFSEHVRSLVELKKIQENETNGIPTHLLISELWNSAGRSAIRGQYSEATLKFYRMLEAACQSILLYCYNEKSAEVDKTNLKDWGLSFSHDGDYGSSTIALSMIDTIHIFKRKRPPRDLKLRQFFVNNEENLKKYITLRNNSMFAHGFKIVERDEWENIRKFIQEEFLPVLKEDGAALNNGFIIVPQLPTSLLEFSLS